MMYIFVSYNNGILVTTDGNSFNFYTYDFNIMKWEFGNLEKECINKLYIINDKLQFGKKSCETFNKDEYEIIEKYYNQYIEETLTQ